MQNATYVFINLEGKRPPAVVPNHNYTMIIRNTTIVEHCTRTANAVFFHPETHSELLSQAGHTPDVHIVTNAFCWKVKSVVCKIKGDICSVTNIYYRGASL